VSGRRRFGRFQRRFANRRAVFRQSRRLREILADRVACHIISRRPTMGAPGPWQSPPRSFS
jgi:hypothetical protein